MSKVHIFTAAMQPATSFVDRCGETPIKAGWRGGAVLMCQCCWQRRRARNCVVQCFYDGWYVCELRRATWTNGPGTDILAGSPACSKFQAKVPA